MGDERIAIVTGANRGLGLHTCRELAQRGYRVLLTARDPAKAEAAARSLREEGLQVEAATLDVASDDSVAAFVRDHLQRLPRIDVLAATLPNDGPSGVFMRDGGVIDW